MKHKNILTITSVIFKRKTNNILAILGPIALGISLTVVAVLLLLALPAAETSAAPPLAPPFPNPTEAVSAAVKAMITTYQNDDGGYTDFSNGANLAPSGVDGTVEAILAIASAGMNPDVPYFGKSNAPVGWLRKNITDVTGYADDGGGRAGKLIMALVAANQDTRNFEGYNFVISLTDHLESSGAFTSTTFGGATAAKQSFAILGLKSVSETIPVTVTQWLVAKQTITGTWDPNFLDPDGSIDATALAIMALVAAGVPTNDMSIISATNFLSDTQLTTTAGWRPAWDTVNPANPNTTSFVIQALIALGQDINSSPWVRNGNTPLNALLEMQNTTGLFKIDFGFGGGPADNFLATAQSIPAVAGKPFPPPWSSSVYLPIIVKN